MSLFKVGKSQRAAASTLSPLLKNARETLRARRTTSKYASIPTCPAPTCECAEMPPDLDIDRTKNLNGSMAAYSQHVLIPTGQADWASKIEDDPSTASWKELYVNVKNEIGPKGKSHDPYHKIILNTCSFDPVSSDDTTPRARALLFPSFRLVHGIQTHEKYVSEFAQAFLQSQKRSSETAPRPNRQGEDGPTMRLSSGWAQDVYPISSPTILICSHNSRDSRCGILGPLLHSEFSQYINRRQTLRNTDPSEELVREKSTSRSYASHPSFSANAVDGNKNLHPVNVGMISHIGGHKWAGNVIVYIPPDYHCRPIERKSHGTTPQDVAEHRPTTKAPHEDEPLEAYTEGLSPLAGKGIWYGRVEPKHVEGIVEQTIGHGKIIKELFRGGVNQDGSAIWL